MHGVQRGLRQDQHRRPVGRAGGVQARGRQGRRGEQHHRPAAAGGVVAIFGRDGVGLQSEQHVTAAVERRRVTQRRLSQLGAVCPPRGHTGGFDHQAGVALLGRHYPDRERRRVGRGGVGDPVAWRVEVDAADGGTVLHRAQTYRAGQPCAAGCGKRLNDKVFHAVTAADAGGFHGMRQCAVEAEADIAGVGAGFGRVGRGRIDVDEHVVVLPAQIRYRGVPAQHRQ